jgi:hypothetical protein
MSTTAPDTCLSVRRLTDVMTRLGDALTTPDLDGLLAAEPLVEELAHALRTATATPADREALLPELVAARLALLRAARLGESLITCAAISAHAQGFTHTYARDGRANRRDPAGHLEARG